VLEYLEYSRPRALRGKLLEYPAIANPFAVLTAVVAPAVLTNASSVLALGTSNRVGRVVDRTRVVMAELDSLEPGSPHYEAWAAQLAPLRMRAEALLRALRFFYSGLGLFASTALVSIAGSIAAYYGVNLLFEASVAVALLTGSCAVVGLAWGCALMVRESKIAVNFLEEEARIRTQYRPAKSM
jgi:hypothetical protein